MNRLISLNEYLTFVIKYFSDKYKSIYSSEFELKVLFFKEYLCQKLIAHKKIAILTPDKNKKIVIAIDLVHIYGMVNPINLDYCARFLFSCISDDMLSKLSIMASSDTFPTESNVFLIGNDDELKDLVDETFKEYDDDKKINIYNSILRHTDLTNTWVYRR